MIRQFDVCRNPDGRTADAVPYVCVLQSHYLAAIDTVIVAPLLRVRTAATATQVAIPVDLNGEAYLLDTAFIANVERHALGRTTGSLLSYEDDIRRALDRLFTGF